MLLATGLLTFSVLAAVVAVVFVVATSLQPLRRLKTFVVMILLPRHIRVVVPAIVGPATLHICSLAVLSAAVLPISRSSTFSGLGDMGMRE